MSDPSSSSSVLDEYLVIQSRLGDSRAFARLVRRWHPRLVRHAYGFTRDMDAARDVAQESWIGVMRGLRSLRDPARFRAWAFGIVANKARDWVRREQARRAREDVGAAAGIDSDALATAASPDLGPREAGVRRIRAGFARLEPGQRTLLTRFYLDEMSVRELAESLDVPVGTIKSRLFYARNALRAALEDS